MPPGIPTPSSPFWSRARLAMTGLAFVLPAALVAALSSCSANDGGSAGGGDDVSGAGGSGSTAASGGVAGGDADATVPDAQPDVTPPTYEDLCGEGPCVPGPADGCSPSLGGGSASARSMGGARRGAPRDLDFLGCQVVADDEGEPTTACRPTGAGALDAPCQGSVDCQPGSACVPTEGTRNQTAAGICRPFCCGALEDCDVGSFCAPRALVGEPDLDVPVCVAVTPCELLEDGSCPAGTTCSVVRADGTTSCAPPGNGELCEPCPCAAGYVCAVHTGLCQKLCRTDGTEDECGGGLCQGGSSGYPAGIGVCVGGSDDACSGP